MKKLYYLIFFLSKICTSVDIDYSHENFVLSGIKSYPLKTEIENIACNVNDYLKFSKFFDTKFIVQSAKVQEELAKDPTHSEVIIETMDQQQLTCSFFDRGKTKIIIIGPGFGNTKEKMVPFVDMFPDYNILILNFRGHSFKRFSINPLYYIFDVDTNVVKLGNTEENDVFAAIDWARNEKKQQEVIGLGICYGAFIFAKAQGITEQNEGFASKGFNKLILDGCWPSLRQFVDHLKKDPYLIVNPQHGGASEEVKWIINKKLVANFIIRIVEKILGISFDTINIADYLQKIKRTPILFFYGKDDRTIDKEEFETLWTNAAVQDKIAIITNKPHVHNHLKLKEVYKLVCEIFIEQNVPTTIDLLEDSDRLTAYLTKKFQDSLRKLNTPLPISSSDSVIRGDKKGSSIPYTTIIYGLIATAYISGKINRAVAMKLGKYFTIYKILECGWRPAIKFISKFS